VRARDFVSNEISPAWAHHVLTRFAGKGYATSQDTDNGERQYTLTREGIQVITAARELDRKVVAAYARGQSLRVIAKDTGMSFVSVRNRLTGHPTRGHGGTRVLNGPLATRVLLLVGEHAASEPDDPILANTVADKARLSSTTVTQLLHLYVQHGNALDQGNGQYVLTEKGAADINERRRIGRDIVAGYQSGTTIRQLAAESGWSRATVTDILRQTPGVTVRPPGRRRGARLRV
jgi:predicted transcriptional regulator